MRERAAFRIGQCAAVGCAVAMCGLILMWHAGQTLVGLVLVAGGILAAALLIHRVLEAEGRRRTAERERRRRNKRNRHR